MDWWVIPVWLLWLVVLIWALWEVFANPKRWLWAALPNATRCPNMYSIKVLVHYSCNRMWSDTKDESLSSHIFLNQSAKPRVTESLLCGFSQLRGTPYSFLIYKMFAMFTFLLEQRKWQLSQKFQILWSTSYCQFSSNYYHILTTTSFGMD